MVKKIFDFLSNNKLFKFIIDLWNVYGGIVLSTIIAKILSFKIEEMEKTSAYLILMIACIGVLTSIKCLVFRQSKTLVDKAITHSSTPLKAIDTATNPVASSEELTGMIIETTSFLERLGKSMKVKIKNFFKRVWGNKYTILNITINFVIVAIADFITFSDFLKGYDFFVNNELAFKIGIPLLSSIYLVLDIFTTITKYGWESLNELKDKSEQKARDKASRLTKEQKIVIKNQIKIMHNAINDANSQIKTLDSIINNFEVFESLGISVSQEKYNDYVNANTKKQSLEENIIACQKELEKFEEMLSQ